jgi:hypothetical protein
MKNKLLFTFLMCISIQFSNAQSAGFNQTYIVVNNTYYDLNAATNNPDFNGANLGSFCQGATTGLTFNGAEHNNYKCGGCDITSTRILYNIHLTTSAIGSFVSNNIPFSSDFSNGCGGKDQRWSKTNYSTNLLAGLTPGNYTIEVYSEQNTSCFGTVYASNNSTNYKATFTIKPLPTIASINGDTTICTPASIQFSNTTASGNWRVASTSVGSINASGLFSTNGSTGNTQIQYIVTAANNCVDTSKKTINIFSQPTSTAIVGASSVCVGASINLNNTFAGGVWSSVLGRATINTTGTVKGTSVGTATIKYTINTGSCAGSVTKAIAVNPLPLTPTIAYAAGTINPQKGPAGSFCVGKIFNVAGTPSGGVWSASGIASVTSAGEVTINAIGNGTLTYTVATAAGCTKSRTISGRGSNCASKGINEAGQLKIENDFIMYPNPAKTFIQLTVETVMGAGTIVVTNLYGKQVKIQSLSLGNNFVDIASLSKGIYLVSTITNEGKTTKKLIVE